MILQPHEYVLNTTKIIRYNNIFRSHDTEPPSLRGYLIEHFISNVRRTFVSTHSSFSSIYSSRESPAARKIANRAFCVLARTSNNVPHLLQFLLCAALIFQIVPLTFRADRIRNMCDRYAIKFVIYGA